MSLHNIDVSHLTPAEQKIILDVLRRDEAIRAVDKERVRNLKRVSRQFSRKRRQSVKAFTGDWMIESSDPGRHRTSASIILRESMIIKDFAAATPTTTLEEAVTALDDGHHGYRETSTSEANDAVKNENTAGEDSTNHGEIGAISFTPSKNTSVHVSIEVQGNQVKLTSHVNSSGTHDVKEVKGKHPETNGIVSSAITLTPTEDASEATHKYASGATSKNKEPEGEKDDDSEDESWFTKNLFSWTRRRSKEGETAEEDKIVPKESKVVETTAPTPLETGRILSTESEMQATQNVGTETTARVSQVMDNFADYMGNGFDTDFKPEIKPIKEDGIKIEDFIAIEPTVVQSQRSEENSAPSLADTVSHEQDILTHEETCGKHAQAELTASVDTPVATFEESKQARTMSAVVEEQMITRDLADLPSEDDREQDELQEELSGAGDFSPQFIAGEGSLITEVVVDEGESSDEEISIFEFLGSLPSVDPSGPFSENIFAVSPLKETSSHVTDDVIVYILLTEMLDYIEQANESIVLDDKETLPVSYEKVIRGRAEEFPSIAEVIDENTYTAFECVDESLVYSSTDKGTLPETYISSDVVSDKEKVERGYEGVYEENEGEEYQGSVVQESRDQDDYVPNQEKVGQTEAIRVQNASKTVDETSYIKHSKATHYSEDSELNTNVRDDDGNDIYSTNTKSVNIDKPISVSDAPPFVIPKNDAFEEEVETHKQRSLQEEQQETEAYVDYEIDVLDNLQQMRDELASFSEDEDTTYVAEGTKVAPMDEEDLTQSGDTESSDYQVENPPQCPDQMHETGIVCNENKYSELEDTTSTQVEEDVASCRQENVIVPATDQDTYVEKSEPPPEETILCSVDDLFPDNPDKSYSNIDKTPQDHSVSEQDAVKPIEYPSDELDNVQMEQYQKDDYVSYELVESITYPDEESSEEYHAGSDTEGPTYINFSDSSDSDVLVAGSDSTMSKSVSEKDVPQLRKIPSISVSDYDEQTTYEILPSYNVDDIMEIDDSDEFMAEVQNQPDESRRINAVLAYANNLYEMAKDDALADAERLISLEEKCAAETGVSSPVLSEAALIQSPQPITVYANNWYEMPDDDENVYESDLSQNTTTGRVSHEEFSSESHARSLTMNPESDSGMTPEELNICNVVADSKTSASVDEVYQPDNQRDAESPGPDSVYKAESPEDVDSKGEVYISGQSDVGRPEMVQDQEARLMDVQTNEQSEVCMTDAAIVIDPTTDSTAVDPLECDEKTSTQVAEMETGGDKVVMASDEIVGAQDSPSISEVGSTQSYEEETVSKSISEDHGESAAPPTTVDDHDRLDADNIASVADGCADNIAPGGAVPGDDGLLANEIEKGLPQRSISGEVVSLKDMLEELNSGVPGCSSSNAFAPESQTCDHPSDDSFYPVISEESNMYDMPSATAKGTTDPVSAETGGDTKSDKGQNVSQSATEACPADPIHMLTQSISVTKPNKSDVPENANIGPQSHIDESSDDVTTDSYMTSHVSTDDIGTEAIDTGTSEFQTDDGLLATAKPPDGFFQERSVSREIVSLRDMLDEVNTGVKTSATPTVTPESDLFNQKTITESVFESGTGDKTFHALTKVHIDSQIKSPTECEMRDLKSESGGTFEPTEADKRPVAVCEDADGMADTTYIERDNADPSISNVISVETPTEICKSSTDLVNPIASTVQLHESGKNELTPQSDAVSSSDDVEGCDVPSKQTATDTDPPESSIECMPALQYEPGETGSMGENKIRDLDRSEAQTTISEGTTIPVGDAASFGGNNEVSSSFSTSIIPYHDTNEPENSGPMLVSESAHEGGIFRIQSLEETDRDQSVRSVEISESLIAAIPDGGFFEQRSVSREIVSLKDILSELDSGVETSKKDGSDACQAPDTISHGMDAEDIAFHGVPADESLPGTVTPCDAQPESETDMRFEGTVASPTVDHPTDLVKDETIEPDQFNTVADEVIGVVEHSLPLTPRELQSTVEDDAVIASTASIESNTIEIEKGSEQTTQSDESATYAYVDPNTARTNENEQAVAEGLTQSSLLCGDLTNTPPIPNVVELCEKSPVDGTIQNELPEATGAELHIDRVTVENIQAYDESKDVTHEHTAIVDAEIRFDEGVVGSPHIESENNDILVIPVDPEVSGSDLEYTTPDSNEITLDDIPVPTSHIQPGTSSHTIEESHGDTSILVETSTNVFPREADVTTATAVPDDGRGILSDRTEPQSSTAETIGNAPEQPPSAELQHPVDTIDSPTLGGTIEVENETTEDTVEIVGSRETEVIACDDDLSQKGEEPPCEKIVFPDHTNEPYVSCTAEEDIAASTELQTDQSVDCTVESLETNLTTSASEIESSDVVAPDDVITEDSIQPIVSEDPTSDAQNLALALNLGTADAAAESKSAKKKVTRKSKKVIKKKMADATESEQVVDKPVVTKRKSMKRKVMKKKKEESTEPEDSSTVVAETEGTESLSPITEVAIAVSRERPDGTKGEPDSAGAFENQLCTENIATEQTADTLVESKVPTDGERETESEKVASDDGLYVTHAAMATTETPTASNEQIAILPESAEAANLITKSESETALGDEPYVSQQTAEYYSNAEVVSISVTNDSVKTLEKDIPVECHDSVSLEGVTDGSEETQASMSKIETHPEALETFVGASLPTEIQCESDIGIEIDSTQHAADVTAVDGTEKKNANEGNASDDAGGAVKSDIADATTDISEHILDNEVTANMIPGHQEEMSPPTLDGVQGPSTVYNGSIAIVAQFPLGVASTPEVATELGDTVTDLEITESEAVELEKPLVSATEQPDQTKCSRDEVYEDSYIAGRDVDRAETHGIPTETQDEIETTRVGFPDGVTIASEYDITTSNYEVSNVAEAIDSSIPSDDNEHFQQEHPPTANIDDSSLSMSDTKVTETIEKSLVSGGSTCVVEVSTGSVEADAEVDACDGSSSPSAQKVEEPLYEDNSISARIVDSVLDVVSTTKISRDLEDIDTELREVAENEAVEVGSSQGTPLVQADKETDGSFTVDKPSDNEATALLLQNLPEHVTPYGGGHETPETQAAGPLPDSELFEIHAEVVETTQLLEMEKSATEKDVYPLAQTSDDTSITNDTSVQDTEVSDTTSGEHVSPEGDKTANPQELLNTSESSMIETYTKELQTVVEAESADGRGETEECIEIEKVEQISANVEQTDVALVSNINESLTQQGIEAGQPYSESEPYPGEQPRVVDDSAPGETALNEEKPQSFKKRPTRKTKKVIKKGPTSDESAAKDDKKPPTQTRKTIKRKVVKKKMEEDEGRIAEAQSGVADTGDAECVRDDIKIEDVMADVPTRILSTDSELVNSTIEQGADEIPLPITDENRFVQDPSADSPEKAHLQLAVRDVGILTGDSDVPDSVAAESITSPASSLIETDLPAVATESNVYGEDSEQGEQEYPNTNAQVIPTKLDTQLEIESDIITSDDVVIEDDNQLSLPAVNQDLDLTVDEPTLTGEGDDKVLRGAEKKKITRKSRKVIKKKTSETTESNLVDPPAAIKKKSARRKVVKKKTDGNETEITESASLAIAENEGEDIHTAIYAGDDKSDLPTVSEGEASISISNNPIDAECHFDTEQKPHSADPSAAQTPAAISQSESEPPCIEIASAVNKRELPINHDSTTESEQIFSMDETSESQASEPPSVSREQAKITADASGVVELLKNEKLETDLASGAETILQTSGETLNEIDISASRSDAAVVTYPDETRAALPVEMSVEPQETDETVEMGTLSKAAYELAVDEEKSTSEKGIDMTSENSNVQSSLAESNRVDQTHQMGSEEVGNDEHADAAGEDTAVSKMPTFKKKTIRKTKKKKSPTSEADAAENEENSNAKKTIKRKVIKKKKNENENSAGIIDDTTDISDIVLDTSEVARGNITAESEKVGEAPTGETDAAEQIYDPEQITKGELEYAEDVAKASDLVVDVSPVVAVSWPSAVEETDQTALVIESNVDVADSEQGGKEPPNNNVQGVLATLDTELEIDPSDTISDVVVIENENQLSQPIVNQDLDLTVDVQDLVLTGEGDDELARGADKKKITRKSRKVIKKKTSETTESNQIDLPVAIKKKSMKRKVMKKKTEGNEAEIIDSVSSAVVENEGEDTHTAISAGDAKFDLPTGCEGDASISVITDPAYDEYPIGTEEGPDSADPSAAQPHTEISQSVSELSAIELASTLNEHELPIKHDSTAESGQIFSMEETPESQTSETSSVSQEQTKITADASEIVGLLKGEKLEADLADGAETVMQISGETLSENKISVSSSNADEIPQYKDTSLACDNAVSLEKIPGVTDEIRGASDGIVISQDAAEESTSEIATHLAEAQPAMAAVVSVESNVETDKGAEIAIVEKAAYKLAVNEEDPSNADSTEQIEMPICDVTSEDSNVRSSTAESNRLDETHQKGNDEIMPDTVQPHDDRAGEDIAVSEMPTLKKKAIRKTKKKKSAKAEADAVDDEEKSNAKRKTVKRKVIKKKTDENETGVGPINDTPNISDIVLGTSEVTGGNITTEFEKGVEAPTGETEAAEQICRPETNTTSELQHAEGVAKASDFEVDCSHVVAEPHDKEILSPSMEFGKFVQDPSSDSAEKVSFELLERDVDIVVGARDAESAAADSVAPWASSLVQTDLTASVTESNVYGENSEQGEKGTPNNNAQGIPTKLDAERTIESENITSDDVVMDDDNQLSLLVVNKDLDLTVGEQQLVLTGEVDDEVAREAEKKHITRKSRKVIKKKTSETTGSEQLDTPVVIKRKSTKRKVIKKKTEQRNEGENIGPDTLAAVQDEEEDNRSSISTGDTKSDLASVYEGEASISISTDTVSTENPSGTEERPDSADASAAQPHTEISQSESELSNVEIVSTVNEHELPIKHDSKTEVFPKEETPESLTSEQKSVSREQAKTTEDGSEIAELQGEEKLETDLAGGAETIMQTSGETLNTTDISVSSVDSNEAPQDKDISLEVVTHPDETRPATAAKVADISAEIETVEKAAYEVAEDGEESAAEKGSTEHIQMPIHDVTSENSDVPSSLAESNRVDQAYQMGNEEAMADTAPAPADAAGEDVAVSEMPMFKRKTIRKTKKKKSPTSEADAADDEENTNAKKKTIKRKVIKKKKDENENSAGLVDDATSIPDVVRDTSDITGGDITAESGIGGETRTSESHAELRELENAEDLVKAEGEEVATHPPYVITDPVSNIDDVVATKADDADASKGQHLPKRKTVKKKKAVEKKTDASNAKDFTDVIPNPSKKSSVKRKAIKKKKNDNDVSVGENEQSAETKASENAFLTTIEEVEQETTENSTELLDTNIITNAQNTSQSAVKDDACETGIFISNNNDNALLADVVQPGSGTTAYGTLDDTTTEVPAYVQKADDTLESYPASQPPPESDTTIEVKEYPSGDYGGEKSLTEEIGAAIGLATTIPYGDGLDSKPSSDLMESGPSPSNVEYVEPAPADNTLLVGSIGVTSINDSTETILEVEENPAGDLAPRGYPGDLELEDALAVVPDNCIDVVIEPTDVTMEGEEDATAPIVTPSMPPDYLGEGEQSQDIQNISVAASADAIFRAGSDAYPSNEDEIIVTQQVPQPVARKTIRKTKKVVKKTTTPNTKVYAEEAPDTLKKKTIKRKVVVKKKDKEEIEKAEPLDDGCEQVGKTISSEYEKKDGSAPDVHVDPPQDDTFSAVVELQEEIIAASYPADDKKSTAKNDYVAKEEIQNVAYDEAHSENKLSEVLLEDVHTVTEDQTVTTTVTISTTVISGTVPTTQTAIVADRVTEEITACEDPGMRIEEGRSQDVCLEEDTSIPQAAEEAYPTTPEDSAMPADKPKKIMKQVKKPAATKEELEVDYKEPSQLKKKSIKRKVVKKKATENPRLEGQDSTSKCEEVTNNADDCTASEDVPQPSALEGNITKEYDEAKREIEKTEMQMKITDESYLAPEVDQIQAMDDPKEYAKDEAVPCSEEAETAKPAVKKIVKRKTTKKKADPEANQSTKESKTKKKVVKKVVKASTKESSTESPGKRTIGNNDIGELEDVVGSVRSGTATVEEPGQENKAGDNTAVGRALDALNDMFDDAFG